MKKGVKELLRKKKRSSGHGFREAEVFMCLQKVSARGSGIKRDGHKPLMVVKNTRHDWSMEHSPIVYEDAGSWRLLTTGPSFTPCG